MPASGMSSSQARPAGLSSAACSEPLGGGAEPSRVGGGLLQERAHPPPRPRSQSLTRSESFSSSHRRASLSPSPSARAAPNLCASWGRSSNDAYDDTCVLFVADRPAVALTLARAFSGGKQVRTRGHGLLKTHDCFGYFAPAGRRCSFAITSVAGHLLVSDLVPPPPHELYMRHGAAIASRCITDESGLQKRGNVSALTSRQPHHCLLRLYYSCTGWHAVCDIATSARINCGRPCCTKYANPWLGGHRRWP